MDIRHPWKRKNQEGNDMTRFSKAVRLALRLDTPPDYGKRRIRRLEAALEYERSALALSEIRREKLREDYDRMEGVVRHLMEQSEVDLGRIASLEDEVRDLQYSLDTAVTAAWSNEKSVAFAFSARLMSEPDDYATAPIDIRNLRDALASDPLEGKITQLNPDTGRHDTVEIKKPVIVRQAQHDDSDFMTPTYVPGMATVS